MSSLTALIFAVCTVCVCALAQTVCNPKCPSKRMCEKNHFGKAVCVAAPVRIELKPCQKICDRDEKCILQYKRANSMPLEVCVQKENMCARYTRCLANGICPIPGTECNRRTNCCENKRFCQTRCQRQGRCPSGQTCNVLTQCCQGLPSIPPPPPPPTSVCGRKCKPGSSCPDGKKCHPVKTCCLVRKFLPPAEVLPQSDPATMDEMVEFLSPRLDEWCPDPRKIHETVDTLKACISSNDCPLSAYCVKKHGFCCQRGARDTSMLCKHKRCRRGSTCFVKSEGSQLSAQCLGNRSYKKLRHACEHGNPLIRQKQKHKYEAKSCGESLPCPRDFVCHKDNGICCPIPTEPKETPATTLPTTTPKPTTMPQY